MTEERANPHTPVIPAHAGYPVRRGRSIPSLRSPEYWVVRPSAQSRTRRKMTTEYAHAFSRHDLPEVLQEPLPHENQRARERPGARCTRGLACNRCDKMRTRAYRFSGNTPAFPAQWLYGLLRARPGDRLSCHHRLQITLLT